MDVLRKETEERETQFLLSDQVFIKTMVPPTKTVCLWLGASVMLEYPLDEAEVLLKQNMTFWIMDNISPEELANAMEANVVYMCHYEDDMSHGMSRNR